MRYKIHIKRLNKSYDILEIITALIVVLTFVFMIMFRISDRLSEKPNYDFSYELNYQDGIHFDTYRDITNLLINDKGLKLDYDLTKDDVPPFLYNFITIKINITDKSKSTSSIKKIETDKIKIDNDDFNLYYKTSNFPVYILDKENNKLKSPAIINFNEMKTQQLILIIPFPLHFSDKELQIVDSLSRSRATKGDFRRYSNGDKSTIFNFQKDGQDIIIHKDFYEGIFNSSKVKFNLIFYDQKNRRHKLKNIIIDNKDQIIKSRVVGKGMYG